MEAMKMIPYIILIIAISGIIAGAGAITLSQFGDTITECWNSSYTLNASGNFCNNNTGPFSPADCCGEENLNLSNEYYTVLQAQDGVGSIAGQIPTIAIISVMVIIISLIAGVFVYMKYFG